MPEDFTKQQEQLEKEEFTESLSDDALLLQILQWEDESSEVYSPLKLIWEQNLNY